MIQRHFFWKIARCLSEGRGVTVFTSGLSLVSRRQQLHLGMRPTLLAMAKGPFLGDRLFGYFGFLIGPQERTCLLDIDQGVRRRFFYALD